MKRQELSEVHVFLCEQFPHRKGPEIALAFGPAYCVTTEETPDKKTVARRLAELRASGQHERALMEEIWHRHNPRTGGRDPTDTWIADLVLLGFEGLQEEPTLGKLNKNGGPSGAYCRVVEHALRFHGRGYPPGRNWFRAAERALINAGHLKRS